MNTFDLRKIPSNNNVASTKDVVVDGFSNIIIIRCLLVVAFLFAIRWWQVLLIGYTSRVKESVAEVYLPAIFESCIDCCIFVGPQHDAELVTLRIATMKASCAVECVSAGVTHCLLNCSTVLNFDFIILSKFSTA